jgi:predicted metal-binding membrane protein
MVVAIAIGWGLAMAAQATGTAGSLHHDALIEGGPPPLIALGLFVCAWQAMIVAMMLPSSLPVMRLFGAIAVQRPRPAVLRGTFYGGYALVWTAFGVAAFLFDMGVHATVDSWPWLSRHDWLIGGSLLLTAGAFQFTPLKYACLDKCRAPGAFLVRYYERGTQGALRLGLRHGAYCLGCCWALMLVMFAAGVASLVWMALLTAVMVLEKTHPIGRRLAPVVGAALIGFASIVLAYGIYASAAQASVPH